MTTVIIGDCLPFSSIFVSVLFLLRRFCNRKAIKEGKEAARVTDRARKQLAKAKVRIEKQIAAYARPHMELQKEILYSCAETATLLYHVTENNLGLTDDTDAWVLVDYFIVGNPQGFFKSGEYSDSHITLGPVYENEESVVVERDGSTALEASVGNLTFHKNFFRPYPA